MYQNNLFCMNTVDWWSMMKGGEYDKPDKYKMNSDLGDFAGIWYELHSTLT